jgi:hypothetical protein
MTFFYEFSTFFRQMPKLRHESVLFCIGKCDRPMAVDRLIQGIFMGCCWFAMMVGGAGQDLPMNLPAAPASGIVDMDGFFTSEPEKAARISEVIQKLQRDQGFKLFLVIEPILIGSSVPQRADELRMRWVPNGDGLVVVYESSTRQLAVGWDIVGGEIPIDQSSLRIPSFKTSAMLNRALGAPNPQLPPEAYLEELMVKLAGEFDGYFANREVSPPPERTLKITLVVVGTFALLGLATMIAVAIVRYTSVSGVQAYRFPTVECTERLAAPCGATVSTRRFSSPMPRD